MKLPFDKLRDKKSRKGKKLFSANTKAKEEASAESATARCAQQKEKT